MGREIFSAVVSLATGRQGNVADWLVIVFGSSIVSVWSRGNPLVFIDSATVRCFPGEFFYNNMVSVPIAAKNHRMPKKSSDLMPHRSAIALGTKDSGLAVLT